MYTHQLEQESFSLRRINWNSYDFASNTCTFPMAVNVRAEYGSIKEYSGLNVIATPVINDQWIVLSCGSALVWWTGNIGAPTTHLHTLVRVLEICIVGMMIHVFVYCLHMLIMCAPNTSFTIFIFSGISSQERVLFRTNGYPRRRLRIRISVVEHRFEKKALV